MGEAEEPPAWPSLPHSSDRHVAVLLGVVTGLLFLAALLVPFRDDYSETGPDPGVRRVSLLSNELDREVDTTTILAATGVAAVAGSVVGICVTGLLRRRGR